MAAKILIVDDEKDLLELLSMNLGREGYVINTAADGQQARDAVNDNRPDLILMDILLPDTTGIKLTAEFKNNSQTADIPIIMLTAKDTETDIVVGLSVGADDYVTKPFSTAVLAARIESVLRLADQSRNGSKNVLTAGTVKAIPAQRQAFVEDVPIDLTTAEFNMLVALIEAAGTLLSREDLIAVAGGKNLKDNSRTIDSHMAALRRKLGSARATIKTVHGQGYRIVM